MAQHLQELAPGELPSPRAHTYVCSIGLNHSVSQTPSQCTEKTNPPRMPSYPPNPLKAQD